MVHGGWCSTQYPVPCTPYPLPGYPTPRTHYPYLPPAWRPRVHHCPHGVHQASFGLNPLEDSKLFVSRFWGFGWSETPFWQNRVWGHCVLLEGVTRFAAFLMFSVFSVFFVNISWISVFSVFRVWSITDMADSFGVLGVQNCHFSVFSGVLS